MKQSRFRRSLVALAKTLKKRIALGPPVTRPGHPLDRAARRRKGPGDSRTARRGSSERASERGVPKTCNYGPGVHQAMPPPVASRRPRSTSSVSLFISVSFLRLSLAFSRFSVVFRSSPLPPPRLASLRAVLVEKCGAFSLRQFFCAYIYANIYK